MANTEAEQVPTITELVRRRIDDGVSARELSRRSGNVVGRQQFDDLSNGIVAGWPKLPEKLSATALALGVDVKHVVLAYARQFGIDVEEDRSALAAMLPANAADLTIPQAQAIAGLIRAFATPAAHAIECETLNLRVFDDSEVRDVAELWKEMKRRSEDAQPAMAHALSCLADVLEIALNEAAGPE